jgi:hypothetical protein
MVYKLERRKMTTYVLNIRTRSDDIIETRLKEVKNSSSAYLFEDEFYTNETFRINDCLRIKVFFDSVDGWQTLIRIIDDDIFDQDDISVEIGNDDGDLIVTVKSSKSIRIEGKYNDNISEIMNIIKEEFSVSSDQAQKFIEKIKGYIE